MGGDEWLYGGGIDCLCRIESVCERYPGVVAGWNE